MAFDFTEVDKCTDAFMREVAADWVREQNLLHAIHLGFWCVSCRSPFIDYRLFVECQCPPPPIKSSFIYAAEVTDVR